MRRTKVLLALIVALTVALAMIMPNTTFADGSVAKVGDVEYATLKEAINNANGSTVTLSSNVTESVTIPAGTTVTIDLVGFTITNTAGNHTITNNGTLTIEGTGTVDNVSNGKAAVYNGAGATCTLNGGTYDRSAEKGSDSKTSGGNSWYTIRNLGTMTINSEVTVTTASENTSYGKYSSLVENGINKNGGSTLTINGGTFSGGINTIKNDDYGTLYIYGGIFKNASQYSVQDWNVATIENGTFEETIFVGNYGDETADKGTLTITGGTFNGEYALVSWNVDGSTQLKNPNVTITGGTFKNTSGFAGGTGSDLFIKEKTEITGGNFVTLASDEESIAEGYERVTNSDGTYTVRKVDYTALQQAMYSATTLLSSSDASLYTTESIATLQTALASAQNDEAITNMTATQSAVNDYATAIETALANLVLAQTEGENNGASTDGTTDTTASENTATESTTPATGDNILTYVAMLGASMMAIVLMIVARKRVMKH